MGFKGRVLIRDAGRAEGPEYVVDPEIREEFLEADRLGSGSGELNRRLHEHHAESPEISGGDLDAAWDEADVGDETVGGSNPTPDQEVVDEIGRGSGIGYQDNERLHTTEKVEERDLRRWELDPASSEDYQERNRGFLPVKKRARRRGGKR